MCLVSKSPHVIEISRSAARISGPSTSGKTWGCCSAHTLARLHEAGIIHGNRKEAPMILDQFGLTDTQFSMIAPHRPAETHAVRRESMTAGSSAA